MVFAEGPKRIPTYKNAVLIYNPAARLVRRRSEVYLRRLVDRLRAHGHVVRSQQTRGPASAALIAREASDAGADLILVAGGDGTVNEALGGMVYSAVPLGLIPGGTGNVLAAELGLTVDPEALADQLSRLVPRRIAVGCLRAAQAAPRYFLLMAGVGFDALIVRHVNPELKARLGKLSYWITSWAHIARRLVEFEVEACGKSYRASFALVSRVRNYGGDLEICRGASLLEDEFEVALLEGEYAVRYLTYFAGILAGKLASVRGARLLRARSLRFNAPPGHPIYVQVDGEKAGQLPATIELAPGAATLLMPQSYIDRVSGSHAGLAAV